MTIINNKQKYDKRWKSRKIIRKGNECNNLLLKIRDSTVCLSNVIWHYQEIINVNCTYQILIALFCKSTHVWNLIHWCLQGIHFYNCILHVISDKIGLWPVRICIQLYYNSYYEKKSITFRALRLAKIK